MAQRYNKNGIPIAESLPRKDVWQVLLGSSPLDSDYVPEVPEPPKEATPSTRKVVGPKVTATERMHCAEAVVVSQSTYGRKVYLHCRTTKTQNVWHAGVGLEIQSDTQLTVVCKTWKVEDGCLPEEGDTILFRVWAMAQNDQGMDVPKNSSFVQVVSSCRWSVRAGGQ